MVSLPPQTGITATDIGGLPKDQPVYGGTLVNNPVDNTIYAKMAISSYPMETAERIQRRNHLQ